MATENKHLSYTFTAAEDLDSLVSGTGQIYKAIALVDRKIANSGEETSGILTFGAKSGEHSTIAVSGVVKAVAGGAIAAGGACTVATSGYITAGDSGDYIIGRNLDTAVASGAVGTILLSGNPTYLSV